MLSIKASLLTVAALCICTTPAVAQDATSITVKLSVAEVTEIERLINMQPPFPQAQPPAFWDLQTDIKRALEANPEAKRAFLSLLPVESCAQ
jgi:hypothetical protein